MVTMKCNACDKNIDISVSICRAKTPDNDAISVVIVVAPKALEEVFTYPATDGEQSLDFCDRSCIELYANQVQETFRVMESDGTITEIKPTTVH